MTFAQWSNPFRKFADHFLPSLPEWSLAATQFFRLACLWVIVSAYAVYFIDFPVTPHYITSALCYVVIQKCKRKTNFIRQLCDTQIVVSIILDLHLFWKNVNKQLKSADFFLKSEKFWKVLLKKVLAIFALIFKHTFIFQIHPHNIQNG